MLRKILAAAILAAAALAPIGARAQVAQVTVPVTSATFSVSTASSTVAAASVPLGGQNYCTVTITNAGGGFTAVPKGASDGVPTLAVVSSINGGSISATGAYGGAIAQYGLAVFQLYVTSITSGTVAGTITCSTASAPSSPVLGSSGATYSVTYPDQQPLVANITAAGTYLCVTAGASQNIYISYAAAFSTGTNSGSSYYFAYGPSSSSLTGLWTGLFGTYIGIPNSSGSFAPAYGGYSGNGLPTVVPAAQQYILPTGMNLYMVVYAGASLSVRPYLSVSVH